MNIVSKKISDLIHPDYNPRQISKADFEQLKKSLNGFGAVEPAVINTSAGRENVIIGGNQRIRAAQAMGWAEYPCYEIDLPIERERELNIRLNKNTGDWDMDALANNFNVDDLKDWGFEDLPETPGIEFEDNDSDSGKNKILAKFEIPPSVWLDSKDKLKNIFEDAAGNYGIEIVWPK